MVDLVAAACRASQLCKDSRTYPKSACQEECGRQATAKHQREQDADTGDYSATQQVASGSYYYTYSMHTNASVLNPKDGTRPPTATCHDYEEAADAKAAADALHGQVVRLFHAVISARSHGKGSVGHHRVACRRLLCSS